ncbi:unnamed protein product [Gongylonema pulchrum]|uniref:Ig-like domain-containing protein n=1 Tax=Gongylonema pulchrum TaxID=637853 RepID=A0A183EKN1_9BILA|nr:unnamed protein product [Gongylonema pulchrum]
MVENIKFRADLQRNSGRWKGISAGMCYWCVTVADGRAFRLECVTGGSISEPFVWYKNDVLFAENTTNDNVHVYTVEHHSLLHFLGASVNDSGHYRCHSGTLISDVAVVVVAPTQDVNTTKNVLKEFPSEMSVPEGGSLILECLPDDPQSSVSWHIVNEYGQPIPSMFTFKTIKHYS